jgi:signal transduction histidine kinase
VLAVAALAAGAAAVSVVAGPRPDRRDAAGRALLLVSALAAFWGHGRDRTLALDFQGYWEAREREVFQTLDRELADLLDRGIRAATTLAAGAVSGNPLDADDLGRLRRETRMTALALYGSGGELAIWDGVHRGRVPEDVQLGRSAYLYGERPLVSYFYVAVPVEGGGTAVAAQLLRSDLPTGPAADRDFAARMRVRTGERIVVTTPERAHEGEVFDFTNEAGVLFSVSLERPSEAERRAAALDRTRRLASVVALVAWLLLALGARPQPWRGRIAALTVVGWALLVPVGTFPGLRELASPADVLLPVPGGLTLARLIVLVAALALAAGIFRAGSWPADRPLAGAALVASGFPLLALAFARAASPGFMAGADTPWLVYAFGMSGSLGLLAWVALSLARRDGPRRMRVALGCALALAMALASGAVAAGGPGFGAGWLALWAVPLLLLRPAGPRPGGEGAVLAWALALVVGTTAALPYLWGARLVARMQVAEAQVERLGTEVDPYLQFLLERTAATVDSLDREGAGPVEILYQGWRESGLAEAGYPIYLTLWSPGGLFQEELRVGFGPGARPAVADAAAEEVRGTDSFMVRRYELADAHYLLAAPLESGRVVTAVVPPLRGIGGGESLLGPLFGSLGPLERNPLTLIPLLDDGEPLQRDSLVWVRAGSGWQGELALTYPGAAYHAHYEIPLPGVMVAVARGMLVLAVVLAALGILWGVGRWIGDRGGRPVGGMLRLAFSTFRARVTFALFAFFALSNLIFGSLAYRTIAGASQNTARVLAERAVNDAAGTYLEVQGEIFLLSRRVGTDLLEYRDGELREASVEELVELGFYEGWVPYEVYRTLWSRESLLETSTTDLGTWEYVTAFRRTADQDGDILGAPVPLQAGAAAVRSREVAHLLTFAVLAGAGLSLVLALLVGRTLTRPIQTLRVASERVGSGNLGVRLPAGRLDEFGAVFEAFNRMVRRLRRARRDLVRTSRRTQAVVEDVATGVIAFDADGVVTVVNPRARELLDLPLEVGERPPRPEGPEGEFVAWLDQYFRDRLREAATELQVGERRLRVRARRIGREGPPAGAVVSLEDVTDELRAERVLAWGEMARQVAHEVKNPLTPIKLSVQHIRRAWEDRRPDFDAILTRNAEAMLREIDRLAAIAAGFSRFGAPGAEGRGPLSPVRLHDVVGEVMTLYAGGDGPIRFVADVPAGLPPVAARPAEIKEALVNLLENARAAIHMEGTVRVEGSQPTRSTVVLRVADDGSGIPAEMLPRIFEPHFSTRSSGTGLGLAIVQRLVHGWGAEIGVASREGEGAEFTVRLRAWPAVEGSGAPGPDTDSGARGGLGGADSST